MKYDVLIIGAGAAGLAAAVELTAAGRRVLLVEARDRIGGRAWSRDVAGVSVPVELGAEFIHGRPEPTFSFLRQTGIAALDSPRTRWLLRGDRLEPLGNIRQAVRRAMRMTPALAKRDISFQQFLARKRGLSAFVREYARRTVEGYDAADPARVSAQDIAEEWTGEGATDMPQFRPQGGYRALMDGLLTLAGDRAALRLNTVVRVIRWRRGRVEVEGETRGGAFRAVAPRAIVTLPLGVLQRLPGAADSVRFDPEPRGKAAALAGLAMGSVLRIAMQFPRAFWERIEGGRYRDASFFHAPYAAFPTFWTALPARTPLLVAWMGGPRAALLACASHGDIVRRALASMEMLFGLPAGAVPPAGVWLHNWQRDPYARGAYSYVTVGGGQARRRLAAPLSGTLFFAGEATDYEGEAATVAGALRSGVREARRILRDG